MKEITFKNWVSYTLLAITFVALLVLGTDQADWGTFLKVHIIATLVIVVNVTLLVLFGKEDLF
jgi:hypothetical protein